MPDRELTAGAARLDATEGQFEATTTGLLEFARNSTVRSQEESRASLDADKRKEGEKEEGIQLTYLLYA